MLNPAEVFIHASHWSSSSYCEFGSQTLWPWRDVPLTFYLRHLQGLLGRIYQQCCLGVCSIQCSVASYLLMKLNMASCLLFPGFCSSPTFSLSWSYRSFLFFSFFFFYKPHLCHKKEGYLKHILAVESHFLLKLQSHPRWIAQLAADQVPRKQTLRQSGEYRMFIKEWPWDQCPRKGQGKQNLAEGSWVTMLLMQWTCSWSIGAVELQQPFRSGPRWPDLYISTLISHWLWDSVCPIARWLLTDKAIPRGAESWRFCHNGISSKWSNVTFIEGDSGHALQCPPTC